VFKPSVAEYVVDVDVDVDDMLAQAKRLFASLSIIHAHNTIKYMKIFYSPYLVENIK